MKVTLDLENLNDVINTTLDETIKQVVTDVITNIVSEHINKDYKELIRDIVNEYLKKSITDYIDNYEIQVGGGFGAEVVTMTPSAYINKTIAEAFETQSVTVPDNRSSCYSSNTMKVSFDNYIRKYLGIDEKIKSHLKSFGMELSKKVDTHIKTQYDKTLQDALCSTVVDVIMQNDAFKSINSKIGSLSSE